MRRGPVLAGGLAGVWAAVGPWLSGWSICTVVYLTNVLPGLLSVATAILALGQHRGAAAATRVFEGRLRLASSVHVLVGSWLVALPLLVGYAVVPALFIGAILPGSAMLFAGLLNGYLGFRSAS